MLTNSRVYLPTQLASRYTKSLNNIACDSHLRCYVVLLMVRTMCNVVQNVGVQCTTVSVCPPADAKAFKKVHVLMSPHRLENKPQ